MEMIMLNNGVQMPMLGLGTWDLRGAACEKTVLEAIEVGYRLIDTAQMYENEHEVGNAVQASGIPREELFLTTKIYRPDTSYQKAVQAIERSLRELKTEYIDLLLIHEPYPTAAEMYRAMEEACAAGKLRAIGVSNFNAVAYNQLLGRSHIVPAVNQVEAHAFFQRTKLHQILLQHGTQMEAWSPFAAGKAKLLMNSVLYAIGETHGKSPAQVALRALTQNGIVAIPKSSQKSRLIENLDSLNFNLSDDEMQAVSALEQGESLFGWYEP